MKPKERHPTPDLPAPDLPAGAAVLLDSFRRRLLIFAGLMVLLGPVLALGLTPFGNPTAQAGWALGGLLGFIGLVITLAQWWQYKRTRRLLRAFGRGDYLAHWTYSEAEWKSFAEAEEGTTAHPAGETYIGPRAAYCGGTFFEYNVLGSSLESITWSEGNPNLLIFAVRIVSPRVGGDFTRTYRIPVPAGMDDAQVNRTLKGDVGDIKASGVDVG